MSGFSSSLNGSGDEPWLGCRLVIGEEAGRCVKRIGVELLTQVN